MTNIQQKRLARHRRNFRTKVLPRMHQYELANEIDYLEGRVKVAEDPTMCFPPAEVKARLRAAKHEAFQRWIDSL